MRYCLSRIYLILGFLLAGLLFYIISKWSWLASGNTVASYYQNGYSVGALLLVEVPAIVHVWRHGLRASYNPQSWTVTTTTYSDGTTSTEDERSHNRFIYALIDFVLAVITGPIILVIMLVGATISFYQQARGYGRINFFFTPLFAFILFGVSYGVPRVIFLCIYHC